MDGRLTSVESSLLELSRTQNQHTAFIEHNTNCIASLDERVTAEIVAIRSDNDRAFTAMRAKIGRVCDQSRTAAVALVADLDTCEVRVSGIPLSVDVTSSAVAERIVSALGLDRLVPHILSVREWAPRRRSPASAPSASVAAPDPELRTMVIRFSSANARETFLAATPKFQRLSLHTIFGITDNGGPTHNTSPLSLPGFNFYHHDRLKRKGGGVGLYVRSDFKVSTIFTSDQRYLNRPEYAVYSIEHCSFKLLLAVVYRRPKASYPFTFFDTISEILHQYKHVLILGDFNINMIKRRNRHTRYIRNLTKAYNLHLVSNSPTHQVSYTDGSLHISCLDLVFTNDPTSINNFNISETPFAAGHHFISFKLSISLPVLLPKTLLLRKQSHIDHTSFNLDLQSELRNNFEGADLSLIGPYHPATTHGSLSDVMHPDLVQATITTSLLSVLDAHAPLQSTVIKPKAKPWFCAELRSLMRTRDRAYRIYSRRRTAEALAAYRYHRRILKNRLDSAKNGYISRELAAASSPNKYWSVLKRIGVTAQKSPSPLTYFSSAALCQHYARVSSASPPLTIESIKNAQNLPLSRTTPTFSFEHVTASDVIAIMAKCSSSSTGPDGVPLSVLKLASSTLAEHIAHLANSSFATGVFPSAWKLSSVIALSKCPTPQSPSDTRPISLLAELSKIIERFAHAQLSTHLAQHNLLDPQQHGFRPGHSTQTALLDFTEAVRVAVDKRKVTILVSFDFSKAFDTIDHGVLITKLRRIGCDAAAVEWFASYLSDRKIAVRGDDGTLSEPLPISSGVPQGSVLGPLLFAIFINDLREALVSSKHIIYADDTAIFQHHFPSKIRELIANINTDANAVSSWAIENKLNLNSAKTKAMILGSLAYVSGIDSDALPVISVNGTNIAFSTSIKCHLARYSLRFYRHALNRDFRAKLAVALVLPHLDYVAAVYNDVSATSDLRLQRLQNACVRFVFGTIPAREHVTPYRLALGWLSVKRRRQYLLVLLALNILRKGEPSALRDLFTLSSDRQIRHSLRQQAPLLHYKTPRTSSFHNSFFITASRIINSLPFQIDLTNRSIDYRASLHHHLFCLDKADWITRCHNENIDPIPPPLINELVLWP
ncbi:uncharacterized protein LOC111693962 [Trichogramma pretiosum]|uniref:uncharacterized protein LOC111693962 n=1 Tax=Trichogramma pretiosum TaxID=7493 RepID=UPI000C71B56B|nr:uncharacterized protein LOC111693962 [Trichogramma pretiosum]